MQLTADQELRRELLLFSLSNQPDLEAAISLAAQMEEFVLRGSRADRAPGEPSAVIKGSDAGQPIARTVGELPKALPGLPGSEMNGATTPLVRVNNDITSSSPGPKMLGFGAGSKKRRWSDSDDERLRRLWHSDHPLEEIAGAMGRTMPSLYSRARALGMSKRSPAADKRDACRTTRSGREPATVGAALAPAGEDDIAGDAAGNSRAVQPKARGPEIEVRRHAALQRPNGAGSHRAGSPLGGERSSERNGKAGGCSLHERAMEAGVEPIIHFLRCRDYSVVRVDNGRFKLDGRHILNAEELREKANQVARSLGKPPFAPQQYVGAVG